MDYSEINIANIYSLYYTIGENVPIFKLTKRSNYTVIDSDKSCWPNGVFNIKKDIEIKKVGDLIYQEISNLGKKLIVISVDNQELDLNLRKNAHKYFPIEQWTGMYRNISESEEFEAKSFSKIEIIHRASEINEWVELISKELFNGKTLNVDVFTYLLRCNSLLIAMKEKNLIIGTALIYKDQNNNSGLYLVCIKKEYRGKGLGKILVEYCLNIIRDSGAGFCILQATKAGLNLYKSLNFQESNSYNLFWNLK